MSLLMAKGLPTLRSNGLTKCTWNLEYVDVVEFLPAPRSLRIIHKAREANSIPTGQFGGGSWPIPSTTAAPKESASRAGRQHMDEMFYAICGDDGKKMDGYPARLPTCTLCSRSTRRLRRVRLGWNTIPMQFRMEAAAAEDLTWMSCNPWQYVSCLPGPSKSTSV